MRNNSLFFCSRVAHCDARIHSVTFSQCDKLWRMLCMPRFRIARDPTTAAALADPYLGQSIGPVPGYGVSFRIFVVPCPRLQPIVQSNRNIRNLLLSSQLRFNCIWTYPHISIAILIKKKHFCILCVTCDGSVNNIMITIYTIITAGVNFINPLVQSTNVAALVVSHNQFHLQNFA